MFAHQRLLQRSMTMLSATGIAIFLALVMRLLWQAPQLNAYLFDGWDPFWLKVYGVATAAIGALVWFRRGRLLLVLSAVCSIAVLLTPMVTGATGWALPKLASITALAVGLGHFSCRRLGVSLGLAAPQRTLLGAVLGYGLVSLIMLFLGLLQLWRVDVVVAVFLLLGMLVFRDFIDASRILYKEAIKPHLTLWRELDLRFPAVVLSAVCVCGAGPYLCAAGPNAHWDVLHYHLGIPTIYVERGGIVPLDHTYAVHLVRNAEMLYGLGLLMEGQPLPTLFNFLFGLLGMGMVVSLGTLLADRRVGWTAGAIFLAVPLVSYVLSEGLIDLIPATYVLAAIYAFFQWENSRNSQWIVLFSLLAGLATGTKLNALIFLAPLALLMLIKSEYLAPPWRERFLNPLRVLLPGAIALAPWLVVTWIRTGNPFFPFLNNIFQSPEWYRDSIADGVDWSGFGFGHNWWYALRLPWDLSFSGERFGELGWFATAGIVLWGLPFGYFALSPRERRSTVALTLLTALSLCVFFKVAQYARYMLPLLGLCAIGAAMNGCAAWRLSRQITRARCVPLVACILIGFGWLLFSRVVHLSTLSHFHPGRYPWKVALGKQSFDDCMRHSSLTDYEFLKFVRDQLLDKPVVFLGVGLGAGAYSGDAIEYSRWHSLIGKQLVEERSTQRLLTMLAEKHVHYLAINEQYVQHDSSWRSLIREAAALRPEFHRDFCEPLFGRNGVVLYRVHAEGVNDSADESSSSLVESEIVPNADGSLSGWGLACGQLKVMPRGSHPFNPDLHVLQMTGDDCVCQKCAVHENTLYTLSAEFWSPESEQACSLQVQWQDASGAPMKDEVGVHEVGSLPDRFVISRTSPPGAAAAVIYLRAEKANSVYMASPRLVERQGIQSGAESPAPLVARSNHP